MQEYIDTMVLEEHQSDVVVNPPLMSQQVSLCIAFFVHLCMDFPDLVLSLCMFCRFIYLFDICYFIQEYIETVVLEEHQSEVVVNPPLPHPLGTCMFRFLWKHHFPSM